MVTTRTLLTKHPKGFTIIEMTLVMTIILIISVIVLTGQNDFNRTLRATDTAYTVATSIRQAQVFGLSSRATGATTNAAYGVHFDGATPSLYRLFVDTSPGGGVPVWCPTGIATEPDFKPGNCKYDNAAETVQNYTFGNGFSIVDICGHETPAGGGVLRCTALSTGAYIISLDVVFIRPNTDTVVTSIKTATGDLQLVDADIVIGAPNGVRKHICLTKVGQISVTSATCPL